MTTGGGQRSARSGFGSSIAEAGIIVTARERTGAAFGKVSENVGGMGKSFLGLGGILLRLMGPTLALTAGVGALVAIIGAAGVVLTSRPWLEWEQAQRKAETTMRMMNVTASNQEAIFSDLERAIGRTQALATFGGDQQKFRNFLKVDQEEGSSDIMKRVFEQANIFEEKAGIDASTYITAFTTALATGDYAELAAIGEQLGGDMLDPITQMLKPMNEVIMEMERLAQIQDQIPITNLEKLANVIDEIGEGLIGVFGPLGNLAAGWLLPVMEGVDLAIDTIVLLVDAIRGIGSALDDLTTWDFDNPFGIFSAHTIQIFKDIGHDLSGIWDFVKPSAFFKGGVFEDFGAQFGEDFMREFYQAAENIEFAWNWVVDGLDGVIAASGAGFQTMWNETVSFFEEGFVDLIVDIAKWAGSMAITMWNDFFVPIRDFVPITSDSILSWFKHFLVEPLSGVWDTMVTLFTTRWTEFETFLGETWDNITGFFTGIVNIPLLDSLQTMWNLVVSLRDSEFLKNLNPSNWFSSDLNGGNNSHNIAFGGNGHHVDVEIHGKVDINADGKPLTVWMFNTLDDEMMTIGQSGGGAGGSLVSA